MKGFFRKREGELEDMEIAKGNARDGMGRHGMDKNARPLKKTMMIYF